MAHTLLRILAKTFDALARDRVCCCEFSCSILPGIVAGLHSTGRSRFVGGVDGVGAHASQPLKCVATSFIGHENGQFVSDLSSTLSQEISAETEHVEDTQRWERH